MISIILFMFHFSSFSQDMNLSETRSMYYNDIGYYNQLVRSYIKQYTEYRNHKLSEEHIVKLNKLEEQLIKGNEVLITSVESYQSENKDKVLLDDVLLMRLAQLEFDKASFEFSKKMSKNSDEIVEPDYEKSLMYVKRLLRTFPKSNLADSAEYMIAYIHEELGEFDKARQIYKYFVKKYPYSKFYDEVRWRLSEIQFEEGNVTESRKGYLELAKKVNSKFEFKSLYKLGATLYTSKLYKWSSKMFLRLYSRLKDDYVSSPERITLYDEALEYLALIQRKGIDLKLDKDIEAEGTKKIIASFKRHGLYKQVNKTIDDFINKNPYSSYLPDFFELKISLYDSEGSENKAQLERDKYINYITSTKNWWIKNKENYQVRFFAEEKLEKYLLESARFLVKLGNKESIDKAIVKYRQYIKRYGLGRQSDQVRFELADIYFSKKQYKKILTVLDVIPQGEEYSILYDNIYYYQALSYLKTKSKNALDKIYSYANWSKNYDNVAFLLLASDDQLVKNHLTKEDHYSKIPYDKVKISSSNIITSFNRYIKYSNAINNGIIDSTLKTKLFLSKMIDPNKNHFKIYKEKIDTISNYIKSGFLKEAKNLIVNNFLEEISLKNYYLSYIAQLESDYNLSNSYAAKITSKHLHDEKSILMALNQYHLMNFPSAKKYLSKISNKFKSNYLLTSFISYKISLLERKYFKAWKFANKIFKATSDDSLIDNLSSYVDASKKMSKVWLNRFKKFGNVYKKYVNKNIDCKVEKNLCLYYSTLKSMKDEDISIYASGLNELLEKENLGLISKLLFKLEAYKNKKIFYENIDFISFFKTYVRKQSLNDPYYYAIQKIHIHYNTQPVEYLIPWDLALHEILEWKNKNIASNKNAILLCNEAKWEECHSELKKDNNVENLMKFYLLTLNYEAASDLYSSLSTEGKENLGYILGLERSPSFDNSIGVLSLVASSKLALDEGNYKKAFSLALQAVQKYPNISYVYTNMMKINLRLKDYMAFDYTLKQMLSNTDSDWANLVSVIIHPSLDERNIRNIYKGAYVSWVSKNEQKDFNGPLGDLNLVMSSLFHRSTENIHPNHRLFGGTQFLYSVYNGKHERIEDGLFSYWLENSRRNTASEVD